MHCMYAVLIEYEIIIETLGPVHPSNCPRPCLVEGHNVKRGTQYFVSQRSYPENTPPWASDLDKKRRACIRGRLSRYSPTSP
jgi:hypothetical protein